MKTIILGIGNPILGDDGIGVHIVRKLKEKHFHLPDVTIEEAQTGGMNLTDLIRGYEKAILIDAVCINNVSHGCIKRFDIHDISTVHSCNPHDVSLLEAIELSKKIGDTSIPKEIIIIGINLKEIPKEFSDTLSPQIARIVPKAIVMVISELKN
jgi:hydrogenase maturation protease